MGDRLDLEALQRRASLMWEEDRQALLANPEAIALPLSQIEAGYVTLAEHRGTLVGFSVLIPGEDGETELDGLFVEPSAWGKGIGRQLLTEACERAQGAGARGICVVANPRAADFYLACGFEPAGEAQTDFGPALSMFKGFRTGQDPGL